MIIEFSIMEKFILWGTYSEDALEKRTPFREEHLNRLSELKDRGILLTLGPTRCNRFVFGIFLGDEINYIRSLVKEDIYWKEGIWTSFEVYSWIQAF